jgi:hypothetical protein
MKLNPAPPKAAQAELHEAGRIIAPRENKGDRYRIRLMGWEPGAKTIEGSSAIYPVAVLERDIAAAFPKGTRMRANHDGICESGGDIRRVISKTISDPVIEADGAYADAQIAEQWSPYMREFADVIGLSISAAGEVEMEVDEDGSTLLDDYGNPVKKVDEATGKNILSRLFSQEESPYNAVDFVEAPGADGRIVAALESAKTRFLDMNVREQATFASRYLEEKASEAPKPKSNREGKKMDPEELAAAFAESESKTIAAVEKVLESRLPKAPEPEEVDLTKVAESAFAAGLTPGARQAVYEAVKNGAKAEDAIAREKAREDEIRKSLSEGGQDVGHADSGDSFGVVFESRGKGYDDAELDAILGL